MATADARPAGLVSAPGRSWQNAVTYLRDPLGYMTSLRDRFGNTVYVPFPGGHGFVFVSEPALIRRILVDESHSFVKGRALRAARRLLGDGLLTSEGADHLRRRRLIQPVFHRTLIERYGEAMVGAAERTAQRWRDGATVDANAEMTRLALEIVGRTIFDADVESEAPEIHRVLDAGMRVFHRFLLPGGELMWRLPLPATRRFVGARSDFDAMVYRLIRERAGASGGAPDLIDHLLAIRSPEGGRALSDEEVRDEAVTLLLAGHETTAQALTWTWLLLAEHPAAAKQLCQELESVLGDRPATPADVPALPYTEAVFREALRLYPPVWALARIASQDVDLGELALPAGSTAIMSQWVVHRDASNFAEPHRFRPERWIDGPAPAQGAYFPFGGGARLCIGERFAMLEGVLVLATLARRWDVRPLDRAPRIDARFTLRPRGGMPAHVRAI